MEKAKEFSTRPHIVSRRVEAGAVVESTVMIPLKNLTDVQVYWWLLILDLKFVVYLFICVYTKKQINTEIEVRKKISVYLKS